MTCAVSPTRQKEEEIAHSVSDVKPILLHTAQVDTAQQVIGNSHRDSEYFLRSILKFTTQYRNNESPSILTVLKDWPFHSLSTVIDENHSYPLLNTYLQLLKSG